MPHTHLSETYLKRQELQAKFKVSRATIYRWTKEGNFPAAIHLGANMVRWKASDIETWLADKEAV
jgi:prophage regulatory protein